MNNSRQNIIFCLLFSFSMLAFVVFIPVAEAQFSIGPGGFVTVQPGGSLMIDTDLHIKSIAGASGALADQNLSGDITITGDITVERYMSPNIWHNVASPVSNESSSCFTGTDLVFWYDESLVWNDWNFGWVWYTGATGGPLTVFRGYDVYFNTNPATVEYNATGTETLNTGAYVIAVLNSDPAPNPSEIPSQKGWNLAGNPYPSPVDWLAGSGWDKSDINDAKYIWDGSNDIYTIFLGGGSPIGINGGTRFIPSNQGFWVQAVQTGTIGINNSTRLCDITGTPDFYKLKPVDYPLLSLVATGNNRSDEVLIRFIEGTTEGFDLNYDASKLFSFIDEVPQLGIKAGKQLLAVSTLPMVKDELGVSLTFQCGKAGYYAINLADRTRLDPSLKVYLKDELEHKLINMSTDSTYGFYHEPSNNKNRFSIWMNPSEDMINDITPESYFSVYAVGNVINIMKNTTQNMTGKVIVINILGQPIYEETINNDQKKSISVNFPTSYYIVYIITDQYIYNSKVLVIN